MTKEEKQVEFRGYNAEPYFNERSDAFSRIKRTLTRMLGRQKTINKKMELLNKFKRDLTEREYAYLKAKSIPRR